MYPNSPVGPPPPFRPSPPLAHRLPRKQRTPLQRQARKMATHHRPRPKPQIPARPRPAHRPFITQRHLIQSITDVRMHIIHKHLPRRTPNARARRACEVHPVRTPVRDFGVERYASGGTGAGVVGGLHGEGGGGKGVELEKQVGEEVVGRDVGLGVAGVVGCEVGFGGVGGEALGVEGVGVGAADGGVVRVVEKGAVGDEADGGFDGEVSLVGGRGLAVVGGELGGHVETVCHEIVGVGAEDGAVGVGEGGVAGGLGVGEHEDHDVAAFFDRLGFGGLVVVADGERIIGADVMDHGWLLPATGSEILHYGLEEKADVFRVHDVEHWESWVYHVD